VRDHGAGSFTTAVSPSLAVLLVGWSLLEGVGAALILPAIVALVAANFRPEGRPRAYGLVMAAGAVAVAVGPLVGGLFTTYLSWRLVFAGEVLIVLGILALARRIEDEPPGQRPRIDYLGVVLSSAGLGLAVFGVLRSSVWGWVAPKPDAPELFGISAVLWLILGGLFLVWLFFAWESRLEQRGAEPLVRPWMFRSAQMVGGLRMFFFQYFIQSGVFFVVPLFLSVSLGLSAIDTGVRLLPLSVTLLIAAAGIPRFRPSANPRRVVRLALLAMFAGTVVLLAAVDKDASAEIVTGPLLLLGLGIGALASQLGAVTVSAVPDELSPEVGGLQNTATNIGASLGTALAGSVLIASLTATLLAGIQQNPAVPPEVRQQADLKLSSGVPFLSDADIEAALEQAGVTGGTVSAIVDENATARLRALRTALAVIAIVAAAALLFSTGIPTRQPASEHADAERGPPDRDSALA
jgi:predicted MFS family arabinose efflux permease